MGSTRKVLLGAVVVILGTTSLGRGDDAPPADPKLRAELLDRAAEDQKIRQHLIDLQARPDGDDPALAKKDAEAAAKEMQEIDARNSTRMKEVVDKCGWPGKSLYPRHWKTD